MRNIKKFNNLGQTLIEAVIAIAVISVVVGSLAIVVILAMNNATYSKNQNMATQYAQQAMDIVRQQSNSDWNTFDSICSVGSCLFCLAESDNKIVAPGVSDCTALNVGSIFIRSVSIENGIAPCTDKKTTAIVKWYDSRCSVGVSCHRVVLSTCLNRIN